MQQQEARAKATTTAVRAVTKCFMSEEMVECLWGLAMKKTDKLKIQGFRDEFHEKGVISSLFSYRTQARVRTLATIRLGLGSCSCSMCGE